MTKQEDRTVTPEWWTGEDDACQCGHPRSAHDRPEGDADDDHAFCVVCECEGFREVGQSNEEVG